MAKKTIGIYSKISIVSCRHRQKFASTKSGLVTHPDDRFWNVIQHVFSEAHAILCYIELTPNHFLCNQHTKQSAFLLSC